MFNLIILIISIALFLFLSLSVIYYGVEDHKENDYKTKNEYKEIKVQELSSIKENKAEQQTQNIVVQKTEVNNYDFEKLSNAMEFITIAVLGFFLLKYTGKLFKFLTDKFIVKQNENRTRKLLKTFNSSITDDKLIVSYADQIEHQFNVNNILLMKNKNFLNLEVLHKELSDKKEMIESIIKKKYKFK